MRGVRPMFYCARIEAFWAGVKMSCIHVFCSLSTCAAADDAVLRSVVKSGRLANSEDGLGAFLGRAVAVCRAASRTVPFFGVRRGSEGPLLLTCRVAAELEAGSVNI